MNQGRGVTLEITVAPVDLPHAVHVLPHQLRQWAGQVDEILFTFDLHTSRGRYGEAAEERRPVMERLLEELCSQHVHARVAPVDYSAGTAERISQAFFGGAPVPAKHHYGGPFYSYFFGLLEARHRHVLHLDSDMLFGGGSQGWIGEAIDLFEARPDMLLCSPFPGPPTAEGDIPPEVVRRHGADDGAPGRSAPALRRESYSSPAFALPRCSTRLFMVELRRFDERVCPLQVEKAPARSRLRAWAEGHSQYALPEDIISRAMQREGLVRIDFLGAPPGMWSLHPPLRSELFYEQLPALIERVERGDVPEEQRGDFDMNDSMIDWSGARAALRRRTWWRRLAKENRFWSSGAK